VLGTPLPHVLSVSYRIGVDVGEFGLEDIQRYKYRLDIQPDNVIAPSGQFCSASVARASSSPETFSMRTIACPTSSASKTSGANV
jgi:hypothetical protein